MVTNSIYKWNHTERLITHPPYDPYAMTYFRYVESGIAYMACGAAFVSGGVGASLLNMLYDLSSNSTALETAALLGMFWIAFGVIGVVMLEENATRNP